MKKYGKYLLACLLAVAALNVALAASTKFTNVEVTGTLTVDGSQTTVGNSTVTGNHSVTGTETLNSTATVKKTLILTQQQAVQLSSFSVVIPNSVYLILSSTGNNITMAGAGTVNAGPISTATATNGQFIILTSTSNGVNGQVTLSSGAASGLDLGAATRVLANGKNLGLIFSSIVSQWVELFYGNN